MKHATIYALSTCSRSQLLRKSLTGLPVKFTYIEVDRLSTTQQEKIRKDSAPYHLPAIHCQGQVYGWGNLEELWSKLGASAEIDQLAERLATLAQKKGMLLAKDLQLVYDLLQGLLRNRDRYGYMACPCRLATGDRNLDKDIICPCAYRQEDIEEYGRCYCGLFTAAGHQKEYENVPERRKR